MSGIEWRSQFEYELLAPIRRLIFLSISGVSTYSELLIMPIPPLTVVLSGLTAPNCMSITEEARSPYFAEIPAFKRVTFEIPSELTTEIRPNKCDKLNIGT